MNQPMKILFAYDGSNDAEAAIDDLRLAGLPAEAQVMVVSVIEEWLTVPKTFAMVEMQLTEGTPSPNERAEQLLGKARLLLQSLFPKWEILADAQIGSPARVILDRADEWNPNLIVVGSSGHSTLGRWLLGSVSQKVLTEAHCSVRVARRRIDRPETPIRIAIGMDGSPGAMQAVDAVISRTWPPGTEVKLITADFGIPALTSARTISPILRWLREERERIRKAVETAADRLADRGFKVFKSTKEGDPKRVLCEEAESWGADCLFVGAKQLTHLDRFLLGSVSASVAARSDCSVEVVR